jgi:hypothetical protein
VNVTSGWIRHGGDIIAVIEIRGKSGRNSLNEIGVCCSVYVVLLGWVDDHCERQLNKSETVNFG